MNKENQPNEGPNVKDESTTEGTTTAQSSTKPVADASTEAQPSLETTSKAVKAKRNSKKKKSSIAPPMYTYAPSNAAPPHPYYHMYGPPHMTHPPPPKGYKGHPMAYPRYPQYMQPPPHYYSHYPQPPPTYQIQPPQQQLLQQQQQAMSQVATKVKANKSASKSSTKKKPSDDTSAARNNSVLLSTPGSSAKKGGASWTQQDDDGLKRAVEAQGSETIDWKAVASQQPIHRTQTQCFHRWQKLTSRRTSTSSSDITKGPWTEEEDKLVVQLVKTHGAKRWSLIAGELPGRVGKQCRERWHNHLNPDICKDAWKLEEDRTILECHMTFGNKWAEISKLLHGR
jgi:hypothetical protein